MAGKKKTMEMLKETWQPILESSDKQGLDYSDTPVNKKANWIHDNKELLFGSINYKGKHIGTKNVRSPDGKETVKAALGALIKETKHQSKFPEVDIAISVRTITVTETKSSMHVCKNKLQRISFCTEEKVMGKDYFCFIVKKIEGQYLCYCFDTQCSPKKINLTVGQAFELAYERFQQAKTVSEMFVTEMKKIKARKGKEDYVRKLEEMHRYPSTEEISSLTQEEETVAPEINYAKKVKKLSSQWQHLADTMKPLREDDYDGPLLDVAMISSPDDRQFDSMMENLNSEFREWDGVKNPLQPAADVQDALKELDSALIPLSSDSLTTLDSHSAANLPSKPPIDDRSSDSSDNEITLL